jgi:hypothetical protein
MSTDPAQHPTAAAGQTPDAPRGVHLVGSVPLGDAEEVFRAVGGTLGTHLHRISDGETGPRSRWNSWTAPTYARTPGLVTDPPPEGSYTPWEQARLTIAPEELVLERIGFADAALSSYATFAKLKDEGAIPAHLRFQVCLPSPIAPMIVLVEEGSRAAVEPAHIKQLFSEIDEILAGVPHDQLAFQFDACQDVGIWEGYYPAYFDDREQGVIDRLKLCAEKIPADVQVGFHLCYGDFKHQHFMNPRDLGVVTAMANRLTAAVDRPIDWIHMPVPADRTDDAYFAPLQDLALAPETEFYLGLLHFSDGPEGAAERIATARRHTTADFGVATECGFGRRPAETIPPLLALHADVAAPIAGS